jgi:hypothetical protein
MIGGMLDRLAPAPPHDLQPGRLWSLWGIMQKVQINKLCRVMVLSATVSCEAEGAEAADKRQIQTFLDVLKGAYDICIELDLNESKALTERLRNGVTLGIPTPLHQIAHDLDHLIDIMGSEMDKRLFLALSPAEAKHFEREHPFGESVTSSFPSASFDIAEAGNCLSCGRYNAVVYHLICAAEVGLRVLAWDRRIKPKYRGREFPLEMAMWGQLIDLLEGHLNVIKTTWRSHSPVKASAEKFYSTALQEIRTFNSWRTEFMHGRAKNCPPEDAIALYGHVSRFMQTLASRMSEEKRTPLIWAGAKP